MGGLLTAAGLGGDFTTGAAFFLATPPFAASAFARGVVARVAVVDAPGDFAGVAFFAGDLAFFAAFFGAFFAGVAFFAGDFAAAGAAFAGVLLVEARGVTGAGALAGVFFAAFFGPFFLVEPPPFWGGAFLAYFVGDGGGAGTRDRQRSEKDDFEFAGASWCVIPPRGDRIGRNARARRKRFSARIARARRDRRTRARTPGERRRDLIPILASSDKLSFGFSRSKAKRAIRVSTRAAGGTRASVTHVLLGSSLLSHDSRVV